MREFRVPVLAVAAALLLWLPAVSAEEACKDDESASEEAEGACQDEEEEEADTSWFPGSLSGNATIITDYSFRGISQTQRDTALQGGFDWAHDSGIYAGLWGSSVTLGDAFLEQDFYGGFANSVGDFSYDVNVVFFLYPQESDFNYFEFVAKGSYDFGFLSVSTGLIGSPDYFGTLGTGFYIPVGIAVPIPEDIKYFDLSVDGNAGYTHTEQIFLPDLSDDHHYWDWNAGLTVSLPVGLSFDFRYVQTDINELHDAGARFIFGTTYAFGG